MQQLEYPHICPIQIKQNGEQETLKTKHQTGQLKPGFSPLGIWSFSIGTSIGWGSFIVTCSTFLQKSGVLGTVLGLLAGMAVVLVIVWNLQYMIQKKPGAGSVYAFEKQMGERNLSFLAFWFILLTYLAIFWPISPRFRCLPVSFSAICSGLGFTTRSLAMRSGWGRRCSPSVRPLPPAFS